MSRDIIDILRCPHSHQPLHRLGPGAIDAVNLAIHQARLQRADGSRIAGPVSAAAASADGCFIYTCRDGIWELLPGSAIVQNDATGKVGSGISQPARDTVIDDVRAFYDDVGWSKDASDHFADASRFEDLRSVSRSYIHRCHMRVHHFIQPRGRYLLDCASGPIQYPEYETYSAGYEQRICVDISRRALREAQRKLGDKGIYIQGDICRLPLADGCVDGAVSLHTIYHVAADSQADAFGEIHRVLSPGATAAVVYSWGAHSPVVKTVNFLPRLARFGIRRAGRLLNRARQRFLPEWGTQGAHSESQQLYFHPHSHRWFITRNWDFDYEIVAWRSVDVVFLRAYIHRFLGGSFLLSALARLEETVPHIMGRLGAYPLIVIRKAAAAPAEQSLPRTSDQPDTVAARAA